MFILSLNLVIIETNKHNSISETHLSFLFSIIYFRIEIVQFITV